MVQVIWHSHLPGLIADDLLCELNHWCYCWLVRVSRQSCGGKGVARSALFSQHVARFRPVDRGFRVLEVGRDSLLLVRESAVDLHDLLFLAHLDRLYTDELLCEKVILLCNLNERRRHIALLVVSFFC